MNNFLLSRALGTISNEHLSRSQYDRQLRSLASAPNVRLTYRLNDEKVNPPEDDDNLKPRDVAHPAGVNSITIDKFEGR